MPNAERARTDLFKSLSVFQSRFFISAIDALASLNRETTQGRAVERMSMSFAENGSFDAETITLLKVALDQAWANLSPEQQAYISKAVLAERILMLAAQGERDPLRLRTRAVIGVVAPT